VSTASSPMTKYRGRIAPSPTVIFI
jgi:hypothetical protein